MRIEIGKIVYGFSETPEPTPLQAFTEQMVRRSEKTLRIETCAFVTADATVAYLEHIVVHEGDGGLAIVTCPTCKNLWAELEAAASNYRESYAT